MASTLERRQSASAQARQWAHDAADDGEYLEAISWLRVLEVIEGSLPPTLAMLRTRCVRAFEEQMQQFADHAIAETRSRRQQPPSADLPLDRPSHATQ